MQDLTPVSAVSVLAAFEYDLNTPEAPAEVHQLGAAPNRAADPAEKARLQGALIGAGALLGLPDKDPEDWFKWGVSLEATAEARAGLEVRVIAQEEWIDEQIVARALGGSHLGGQVLHCHIIETLGYSRPNPNLSCRNTASKTWPPT
jgi:hypothetical protein